MTTSTPRALSDESGFTLIEVMVTSGILMAVSAIVMSGVLEMTQLNNTITNRAQMFAGVRNATALLQQEVGQAGRVTTTASPALMADVLKGTNTVSVSYASNMYVGEHITVGTGNTSETVTVTTFANDHANAEKVSVMGSFSAGVIPPAPGTTNLVGAGYPDGSTDWVLKIFGDINGTGNMVYVEYTCDIANGLLYRNQMPWNAGAKVAPTVDQILVENVQANPKGAPCFTYQTESVGADTFVIGVAITLTVQSQDMDPITKKYQKESKALLNVSPRNVFNAWKLASADFPNRVQPIPPEITKLLPKLQ
jgi:type II secretory pathway pseudopilin PulG